VTNHFRFENEKDNETRTAKQTATKGEMYEHNDKIKTNRMRIVENGKGIIITKDWVGERQKKVEEVENWTG
jgi:hypothetical protein